MVSDWATVFLGGAGLLSTASVAVWSQMRQDNGRREQHEREDRKERTRIAAEVLGSIEVYLVDVDPQRVIANANSDLYGRLEKTEYHWNEGPRIRVHSLAVSDYSPDVRETAGQLGTAADNVLHLDRNLLEAVLEGSDLQSALEKAVNEHRIARAHAARLGALLRNDEVGEVPRRPVESG